MRSNTAERRSSGPLDLAAPIRSWMPPVLYMGSRFGLPLILLARWPAELRQEHPYKTWICETVHELAQVQARLDRRVPITAGRLDFTEGPDGALGPAQGAQPHGQAAILFYEPPAPGWPWLVLVSLGEVQPGFERDRYGWEACASHAEAIAYVRRLGLSREEIRAGVSPCSPAAARGPGPGASAPLAPFRPGSETASAKAAPKNRHPR